MGNAKGCCACKDPIGMRDTLWVSPAGDYFHFECQPRRIKNKRSMRIPRHLAVRACENCQAQGMIAGVSCRICNAMGWRVVRKESAGAL